MLADRQILSGLTARVCLRPRGLETCLGLVTATPPDRRSELFWKRSEEHGFEM